ncbi:iron complex outermembrane receptor protein [Ereboglobus sp. PH5-10]|uniref:TonB-dependent receptor plug domain-containing protein n=1 Tax=Ereboglobus sp. PH5-10 TaxID=2940629 RepID=UPI0024065112|nr:TonB-dependent receptor [Ereboglobus sp. PH5-10]MDF9827159.1 iron complex outermembrane receptor protein [Ereboglobus sp. PH5-10]
MKTKNDSQVGGACARSRKLLIAGAAMLLSTTLAFGQATKPANETKDDVVHLEKHEVLGTRIKRVDIETASPVQIFTADQIEASGYVSMADVVRSLPFMNGQALTPVDAGTSFTPGVNSFNLRGLGSNNTLVLLNGRRTTPYASPGFNGFMTVFDINSIPDAAIESMSILKDGGSAIYGSDAVAGVIDFKLKNDYVGVNTTVQAGNHIVTDGLVKKASLTGGVVTAKTHIMFAANWHDQKSVYARDLGRSKNADKTSLASKADPRWESPVPISDFGLPDNPADVDYLGLFDGRSSMGYPGYVSVGGSNKTFAEATDTPTVGDAVTGSHLYNFQEVAGLFPDIRRFSFYTRMKHDFTPWLYGFAELSFSRSETQIDAAPTPVNLAGENGLTVDEAMYIPSYNAYNPWGVDIASGRRRLVEVGNRVNDVTSDTPRILVGLGGTITGDWTWEAGALYSKNTVTNRNLGSVADYKMQQALMGLTRMGDGSLTWDPTTAIADREYFNWFGLNEQAFVDFLSIENPVRAAIQFWNYDVKASGSLISLPGGMAGIAVGAERRTEKLASSQTDLNQTGNIIGGSQGTSFGGQRDVNAIYAEVSLPFTSWLEAQVAGRWEDYSDDGIKSKVRPKVGLKFKPLPWLVLRTSYSESFKAPDLAYLYTKGTTTFTSGNYVDPVTGNSDQLQIRVGGNPDLKPETTDTYYGGVVIEPQSGWLKGFVASVDFFYYKQKDLLAQLTDFYAYNYFLEQANLGNPLFAPMVVRAPDNTLLYIRDDYTNISSRKYKGIDFEASYRWNTDKWGKFQVKAAGTYLISDKIDGDNIVGTWLTPRFNAVVEFNWAYRDWSFNVYETYLGDRDRKMYLGYNTDPEVDPLYLVYTVKKQLRTNASVTYSGFRQMKITVGATNIFNQTAPVDPYDGTGTTAGINDPSPALWYVRVSRDF